MHLLHTRKRLIPVQLLALVGSVNGLYDCPMDPCDTCLSADEHDAPGFGFDLTTGYGTSAVHLYNGTSINLARVDGDDSYRKLMSRLSRADPPGNWHGYLRWARKKLGLPSTPDVGVLAAFLRTLKDETFSAYQNAGLDRMDVSGAIRVVVSNPVFPALTPQDLTDALEYVGLGSWTAADDAPFPYPHQLSTSRAVYAASGNGLCRDYKNLYECQDEFEDVPVEKVYYASMTRHALYASVEQFTDAFGRDKPSVSYAVVEDAGLDHIANFAVPSVFWAHVRRSLILIRGSGRPITQLVLGGENATNADFLANLKDALGYSFESLSRAEETDHAELLFAAARGAALYARRRQESHFDCLEDDECEKKRERERREHANGIVDESRTARLELR